MMKNKITDIRPYISLINEVNQMTWKKDKITDIDKKLFNKIASNPDKKWSPAELSKETKIPIEQIKHCVGRLYKKDLITLDFWQVFIINGIERPIESIVIESKEAISLNK